MTSPEDLSPAERYALARARAAEADSAFGRFRTHLGFEPDEFQVEACRALEAGQGVLVAAPTGAGKTVVGEFAVHLALEQGLKAFYTTPIKALSNQKYADFVRRHGHEKVGLLTGDVSINGDADVVVMTTEVLRNMLYAGSPALTRLGHVVMDEVHYLADRFRGPVWEEVIIHLPQDVRVTSLSATVSNAEEFGDWLATVRGATAVIVSEQRPVPLWQHVMLRARPGDDEPRRGRRAEILDLYAGHVDPTDPGVNPPISPDLAQAMRRREPATGPRRGRGRPEPRRTGPHGGRQVSRAAAVDTLDAARLLPAIHFIFSRAGCEAALAQCLGLGLSLTSREEEVRIRHLAHERCADLPAEDLGVLGYASWVEGLSRGFATHHAGMLPLFKQTVEELFAAGLLKVVFATETLALGINMPARTVVLEKLVKWDGRGHADLTAGEYTQLTGRAGRRGIDVEGHAVVLDHPGLDPVALAGLASRRTYPLRSSFRPTYNMAVNLVGTVGRARTREVLETSFAQFQADRGAVGLAAQARKQSEAIAGYAEAMTCHLGDFAEYSRLRQRISQREGALRKVDAGARQRAVVESLAALRRGDVIAAGRGRRASYAVVVSGVSPERFGPGQPVVLTEQGKVRRIDPADLLDPVEVVATVRVPASFEDRRPADRRDLASALRSRVAGLEAGPSRAERARSAAADDAELEALRRSLRAHPCHRCPDREQHARWAERHARLTKDHANLVRRIEGRTGTIARQFDRVCDLLVDLGYLAPSAEGSRDLEVTAPGRTLRHLYAEKDLLVAECLRKGAWTGLDAPGLAAVVTAIVHEPRGEEVGDPHLPGGQGGPLARAIDATVRAWSHLEDLETAHRLDTTPPPSLQLVEAVFRWAAGRSLEHVLRGAELAAGDFVRICKQVIDVLDQVAKAADEPRMQKVARDAVDAVRRGVVAHSGV